MSLVKKPEMTEKKVAANTRNRKLAHGPATAEGRERIRAALLRHGFYAQAEEVAMRAVGEDPAHYQELLEELWETTHPNARLMRRMQDSNFREVRRVTNLPLKLKRHELRMEALGKGAEKQGRVSRDVSHNKGVSCGESKPLKI
jgi:hypothetical protein